MITPLFSSSMNELQKSLGVAGMQTDSHGFNLLEQSLSAAKSQMYLELGLSRVNELVAIVPSENPTTADEYLRDQSRILEVKMTKREIIRSLGSLVPDGQDNAMEEWNEISILRGANTFEIRDELIRLDRDIAALLSALKGETEIGNPVQGNFASIEPDTKPDPVGSSNKYLTSAERDAWSEA